MSDSVTARTTVSDSLDGVVVNPRGDAIRGAVVRVSGMSSEQVSAAQTDSAGRFLVVVAGHDDRYFVDVSAVGYDPSRLSIRVDHARGTIGHISLRPASHGLPAVVIVGKRSVVFRPPSETKLASGTSESARSGFAGSLGGIAHPGEIEAMAYTDPALSIVQSADGAVAGVSAFGLPFELTATSIDGLQDGLVMLPLMARVEVRASASPYDISRGGFSGAQFSVTTTPGANISERALAVSAETQGSSAGQEIATTSAVRARRIVTSASASGPVALDRVFYALAVDVQHEESPASVFSRESLDGLVTRGIAPAVARSVAGTIDSLVGAPGSSVRDVRSVTRANALMRLDVTPDTLTRLALGLRFALGTMNPFASSPLATPEVSGHLDQSTVRGTLAWTTRHVHTVRETTFGFGRDQSTVVPFAQLPLFNVRVVDTNAGPAASVLFGSATDRASARHQTMVQLRHGLWWQPGSDAHVVHVGVSGTATDTRVDADVNTIGTIAFASLDSLRAGTPALFTRTTGVRPERGRAFSAGAYAGDVWTPRRGLTIQYGARLDANALSLPDSRGNVDSVTARFGPAAANAVRRADLSPRIGVSWDTRPHGPYWFNGQTFRAGVGRFVSDAAIGNALRATEPFFGSDAPAQLVCRGADAPAVDWTIRDFGLLAQTACRSGTPASPGQLTGAVLGPHVAPPSSWRTSAGFETRLLNVWFIDADISHSTTQRLPSIVDLNFADVPRGHLDDGRPVFSDPTAVTAAGNFSAPPLSRHDTSLGSVLQYGDAGRSRATQISLGLKYWVPSGLVWQLGYAWTDAWDYENGFTGTTASSPLAAEWSPNTRAPRHALTMQFFYPLNPGTTVLLLSRIESGRAYTPVIAGDVNGDGRINDRTVIPNPSTVTDPDVGRAMSALVSSSAARVRECLHAHIGTVAAPNSCRGPWGTTADLMLRIGGRTVHVSNRVSLEVAALNLTGAVDDLLHGAAHERGWAGGLVDPVLLTPLSYDPLGHRYTYAVNSHFGSLIGQPSATAPFRLRLGATIALAPDVQYQQMAIDRERQQHPSAEMLMVRYVTQYPNPALTALAAADSADLSTTQRDSLRTLALSLENQMRSIWLPVARFVSAGADPETGVRRIQAARTPAAINYAWCADAVRAVLTSAQLQRMPWTVQALLDRKALMRMGLSPDV